MWYGYLKYLKEIINRKYKIKKFNYSYNNFKLEWCEVWIPKTSNKLVIEGFLKLTCDQVSENRLIKIRKQL